MIIPEISSTQFPGLMRFMPIIGPLHDLLNQASKQESPGKYIYEKGGRTLFFQLEGLARIYDQIHNKKRFGTLHIKSKEIEDKLGLYDYYLGMIPMVEADGRYPELVIHLKEQSSKALKKLDIALLANEWTSKGQPILDWLTSKLQTADWLDPNKDRKAVLQVLLAELYKIQTMYANGEFPLWELSSGLHELRRQVRWLSINAQITGGLIVLRHSQPYEDIFIQYMTDEILNLPYNNLPVYQPAPTNPVLIPRPLFYALSWVILELGKIKDIALCHDLIYDHQMELGVNVSETKQQINLCVDRARIICDQFFYNDRIWDHLTAQMEEGLSVYRVG